MSPNRGFAAAFAVVALTQSALGQTKPDSASLRFAWPVGMTAHVDQAWTRMQLGPRRNDSVTVRSRYRMTVSAHPKGRLIQSDSPCTDGEAARRCVRLEMISEPDSAALRKVVTDFMAKLAPKDANVAAAFQSMRVANELTVVADPRDLRPYSMSLVKTVEVEGAVGPNESGRTRRVDIRTARYTYAR